MELKGLLPCLQEPVIGLCPEPINRMELHEFSQEWLIV
jgi:hypothetical protein